MTTTILENCVQQSVREALEQEFGKSEQAHIVMVPPNEPDTTPQAYVMRARVEGFPVTALCGYTWVPNKQATGLPVCEECKAIYENDPFGKGDRDNLPDE